MKISISCFKNAAANRMLAITFLGLVLAPVAAFSQQAEEENSGLSTQPQPEGTAPSTTSPGSGSALWENSAGAAIGTSEDNTGIPAATTTTAPARDTRLGTATGSGIRAGATPDGRDPGGNPDVPFDDNMNLAFLAAGIVFSFLVITKKMKWKAITVSNK